MVKRITIRNRIFLVMIRCQIRFKTGGTVKEDVPIVESLEISSQEIQTSPRMMMGS